MIIEKPILFNGEMVRAVLAGRKTQTRRVVKYPLWAMDRDEDNTSWPVVCDQDGDWRKLTCPYGEASDRLWVRETWGALPHMMGGIQQDTVRYRANGEYQNERNTWRWRPSIHMPRWVSRITLEVTAVRVERVQDITEADALAEGFRDVVGKYARGDEARIWFAALWESINAKRGYGWSVNPFVWVVEFKLLEVSK